VLSNHNANLKPFVDIKKLVDINLVINHVEFERHHVVYAAITGVL